MQRNFLQSGKISDLVKNRKPLVMGILNVTPDSFSDGGKYFQIEDTISHAKKLIDDGVDIIDVGGESTKPGANLISEEEELKRVIPVIYELKKRFPNIYISIDTYKSNVAQLAINAGAKMINDVSGLTMDPDMVKIVAKLNLPIVIMHNNGIPATKPDITSRHCEERSDEAISQTLEDCHVVRLRQTPCNDAKHQVITEVYAWFQKQTQYAIDNGIQRENIIIDPGLGFGKTAKEDLCLIENLQEFKSLGFPILIGPSKKSFIKKLFGEENIELKSKEIVKLAIKNGADIVRVH